MMRESTSSSVAAPTVSEIEVFVEDNLALFDNRQLLFIDSIALQYPMMPLRSLSCKASAVWMRLRLR